MPVVRDESVLIWREPAGTMPLWARAVIACACIATVAMPAIGCRVLWTQSTLDVPISAFVFQNGLALLAVVAVVAMIVPRWRLPRLLRVAMLLPVAHVAVIAAAWPLWRLVAPGLADFTRYMGIANATSLAAAAGGLGAISAVAALAIAWRRRDAGWTHAFALIGLVMLLALGLWLPVASRIACSHGPAWRIDPALALEHPRRLALLVLAPPIGVALAYSAFAIRLPTWARQLRPIAIGVVVAALALAIVLRAQASPADAVIYANFIPLLLAAMLVACTGLAALGLGTAMRAAQLGRRVAAGAWRGTVVADDNPVVAVVEIAGWLRAPRPIVRSFVLATDAGELPIHGARLIAPLTASTTTLHVGEAVAVLRAGDVVDVASLRHATGGDPFRTLATPIAGEDVVVAPRTLERPTFADMTLATWRPAVAYLVILVALAVPALAATLTTWNRAATLINWNR
jgi:hypothetical protein